MSESYSKTPIALFLLVLLSIGSAIFVDIRQIFEGNVSHIYDSIVVVTVGVYIVSSFGIVKSSDLVNSTEPQTPLGMLGSKGIGPFGNILGEFLQVFGFLRASQLMIIGIVFDGWNHNLPTMNYIIIVIVTIGLSLAALITVFIRAKKVCLEW